MNWKQALQDLAGGILAVLIILGVVILCTI